MPSSAPSTPPTRPVPIPSSDPESEPPPNVNLGIATPVDAEAEIDASTLRFLSSSFRALFLPWLFRLAVFTACAKLVRFSSPCLFTTLRYLASYLWTALAWLVAILAWLALWAGLIATAGWCLAGLVGFGVYWLLRARPTWNRYKLERPTRARYAKRAAAYAIAWSLLRFGLRWRNWATRISLLVVLGVEARALLVRSGPTVEAAAAIPTASSFSSPSSPPPPPPTATQPKDHDQDADGDGDTDDLAERWARQVREEMLRESLLAQGKRKKAAATHPAASTTATPPPPPTTTDTTEETPAAEGISIETAEPSSQK
ncbi:hypothetical protein RHOSPDRAFT_36771 [Rhodotorula sp. JG-1b]|nr:hypothetical protein RHOSPDRAFT_36771 [Rhodotorula sp. JG-1b]